MLKALAFVVLLVGTVLAQTGTLSLGTPQVNQQLAASDLKCYQLTLTDAQVREVVFWENPKLFLQLTPCKGRPHMKISVYGCPSQTKTVYEFMSDKMKNDAIAQGNSASIPKDWEWPGDVETLTIDITHKTYYIEINNLPKPGGGAAIASEYELYADRFDANGTTVGQPHSKEDLFPLKFMSSTLWDRKVSRDNGSDTTNSFSFGGGATTNIVTVNFYPPGLPGATGANVQAALSASYEYSVFVLEITSAIGTSAVGPFVTAVPSMCPSGEACTSANCRSCANDYPKCPKEFLTDCTETTLNVAKLKDALNSSATAPFDSYVKDPSQWTAWTVCGSQLTMNRVDGNIRLKELSEATRRTDPLVWFAQSGPQLKTNTRNQLALAIEGLKDDNNNVYLVNVIVRKQSSTTGSGSGSGSTTTTTTTTASNSTETAIYEFMTLQMRTPRYETPKLNDTDYAVIIGVSCGLGACIVIFVGVAILVRHKRKQKLAQRIRMKK